MGREDKLEEALNQCLNRRAELLEVPSSDTEGILRLVHERIKEKSGMKKWSTRNIIIAAAAICMLSTVTGIAAGKAAYMSAASSHKDRFAYGQLKDMEQKAGFATKAPETFSNGYTFEYGVPVSNKEMDEEQNVIRTAESLGLTYQKDGMPDITIDIQSWGFYDGETTADETFSHGEITLGYRCDNYRFVPADYQISQEEQALVDAGDLYVSYGSAQVEDSRIQFVLWTEGEVHYIMMSKDNAMTAEELVQMAGEIIDNK
ncbi:MAG: hypothetical protein SOX46_14920 [Clostridiaceae bacterium]|uniref:DUF4367 domain-containing protein n=1 Tax=Clostridium porci TaxID=2605778 RepID=A0A7X2NLB1_9CLOT|nr:hypothetical protein [Clostridium porci]MDY3232840.1 hypothetical protein [Clostridiaceae bacterium]MSS36942.1 hypothetical protein [Clostridium porci]